MRYAGAMIQSCVLISYRSTPYNPPKPPETPKDGYIMARVEWLTFEDEAALALPTEPDQYGNFDIILDLFSRIGRLHPTAHAPCATLYLVPMLIGC